MVEVKKNEMNEKFKYYLTDFENLPYGTAIVKNDAECTIIQASAMYYKIIGYTKEQLMEQHKNHIAEILVDNVYNLVEKQSTEQDYNIEWDLRLRTSDGEIRWIHDFAHYNKNLDVFFITITDITDKMIATVRDLSFDAFQTRNEILGYLNIYTTEYIIITDAITDEIVYVNPSASEMLGLKNENDWLGKPYCDVAFGSKENTPPFYHTTLKELNEDDFRVEEGYNDFYKMYCRIKSKIITVPRLNRKMRLHLITDITAQKRLEHKIEFQKTLHNCIESLFTAGTANKATDEAYYDVLKSLKKYYHADRAFFYKFKDKTYEVDSFYEVLAEGIKTTEHKLPMVVTSSQMKVLEALADSNLSDSQNVFGALHLENQISMKKLHSEYNIKNFSCVVVKDTKGDVVAFMGVTNPQMHESNKELMEMLSHFIYMLIEHQEDKLIKEEANELEAISKANIIEKCEENFRSFSHANENITGVLETLCAHYGADFAVVISQNKNSKSYGVAYVGGTNIPNLDFFQHQPEYIMDKWAKTFDKHSLFVTDAELEVPNTKKVLKDEFGIYNFIVSPIRNVDGIITGLVFVNNFKFANRANFMVHVVAKNISDYLDRLGMQAKVQLEPATQLTNKVATQKLISNLLEDENKGTLFIIDIDNFKVLNDTLGHFIGDQTIIEFAGILKLIFSPTDIIGRIGGDEFMVFSPNLISEDLIDKKAKQIVLNCNRQYENDGITVGVTASVGVCSVDDRSKTYQPLYENADYALYIAKKNGKNQHHIYVEKEYLSDTSVKDDMRFYHTVVKTIKSAIDQHRFVVHYQPIYHMPSEKFTQAEALIRIRKNDGTLIYPNDFIHVAESTGLIMDITYQMLEQVCRDFSNLLNKHPNTTLSAISINVPYVQFTDPNMEEHFMTILERYKISPKQIKIEITERIIVNDVDMMTDKMNRMIDKGFDFELDDFGTDYSNLQMSLAMPMDVIKLDRSLLLSAMSSESNRTFFQHLLSGVNSIGRKTLLEGVETQEQLNWAAECNCEFIQGYYFSKPVDFEKFSKFLLK